MATLTIAPADGVNAPQVEFTSPSLDRLIVEVAAELSTAQALGGVPVADTTSPHPRWTVSFPDGTEDTVTITGLTDVAAFWTRWDA